MTAKRKQPSNAVRKLRKSCSLPTCGQEPGTCMHCTCDGRCGRHLSGLCGGRREGSGRGCKRAGCSRDDKCLHSNRATCCHCRNLVSSSGRAKRPRVALALQRQLVAAPAGYHAMKPATSKVQTVKDDLMDAELSAFLRDANLGGDLALCEFTEWSSRKQLCNLVVTVCGTQFNLHKHPMLMESRRLHRMAREAVETPSAGSCGGAVPVLELPTFPGGADMFETLAIYCYSGEITFSLTNLAVMHCAIEFLEMRADVRLSSKQFLDRQVRQGSDGLNGLLQVVNAAETLAQAQPELFRSSCDSLVAGCLDRIVRRGSPVDADSVLQFFTLPSERFIELTQMLLTSQVSPPVARTSTEIASELCVQAKLAQLHRNAQRIVSPRHCSRALAEQCVQLLRGEVVDTPEVKSQAKEEPLDLGTLLSSDNSDKLLIKLMDEDLSACAASTASALVDASICFSSDSLRFAAHSLPEAFVV